MRKLLYTATVFTLLCMILPMASVHCFEPFSTGEQVRIKALYEKDSIQGLDNQTNWTVQYSTVGNKASWKFYQENKGLFCIVDADKETLQFSLKDARGALLQKSTGGFVPVSGFPVPCQIFAIEKFRDKDIVKTVRLAGGRRFVLLVSYSCETIEYETAIEKGWLTESFSGFDPEAGLFMVTFKNSNSDAVLFRQLWQKDAGWWLYQEAEIGRFWRY